MSLMDRLQKAAAAQQGAHPEEDARPEAGGEEKPDLIEYLKTLPEVEVPYPPFEEDEPVAAPERSEAEKLADEIRFRTRQEELTSAGELLALREDAQALLEQMRDLESCADISKIAGQRDTYYYSSTWMTDNYARIAMLVRDKDWPRTIAEMVRFNCKTYPSATPYEYFTRPPYLLTMPQIERALTALFRSEDYRDIVRIEASNGSPYLYSTTYFTERYAKALANLGEDDSQ